MSERFSKYGINTGKVIDIKIEKVLKSGIVKKIKIYGTNGEYILKASELRKILGFRNLKSEKFIVKRKAISTDIKSAIKYAKTVLEIIKKIKERKTQDLYFKVLRPEYRKKGKIYNFIAKIEAKKKIFYEFQGYGYGHGVGMCQEGAIEMAKIGKSYRDILKFYFPNTKIRWIKE